MASTSTRETRETKAAPKGRDNGKDDYEDVPEPLRIDGYWAPAEGVVLEGILAEVEPGNYGDIFKIKTTAKTFIKGRDGTGPVEVGPGKVVGANETMHIKALKERMGKSKVPLQVRIEVLKRRDNGKGWEMSVKAKPAF